MKRSALVWLIGAGALVAIPAVAAASAGAEPGYQIKGTWQVVIDPQPTPAGDQPAFESLLAFGPAQEVIEATSKSPNPPGVTTAHDMTAGLGSWVRTGSSTFRFVMQKYRFDATGAYIGKTVVTEDVTLTSPTTYVGHAVTKVFGLSGTTPAAQFLSVSEGLRLAP